MKKEIKKTKAKSKKESETKLSKKAKIIIAVVASVLLVAGISLGIHFGLKAKEQTHETVFATTGELSNYNENDNTILFSYLCPYLSEKSQFYVENTEGFYLSYEEDGKKEKISGKIIEEPEYQSGKTDSFEGGRLTLTIKLDKKLKKEKTFYHAVLEQESISLKKENYINPEITEDFSAEKSTDGTWTIKSEKFINSKLVVPSNVEAKLTKENGKAYFVITAQVNGITKYNEEGHRNLQAPAFCQYKTEDGIFTVYPQKNIEFSSKDGTIFFKGEVPVEHLIPGQDYNVTISKGFLTNNDKSVINDEYKGTFTYVE